MKKLTTAYVMYTNTKLNRSGALFEGRFKSRFVGTDEYLKYLFSYIHLNPVKIIEPKWRTKSILDKVHIQKFLDTGGELKSLTVSRYEDGTLILRADERTIVTVRMIIEGRKLGGAEFKVLAEPSEY